MEREEFDKLVEETDGSDPRQAFRSRLRGSWRGAATPTRGHPFGCAGRLPESALRASAGAGAPQEAQAKGSRTEPLIESLHAWTGIPYPSGQHV